MWMLGGEETEQNLSIHETNEICLKTPEKEFCPTALSVHFSPSHPNIFWVKGKNKTRGHIKQN